MNLLRDIAHTRTGDKGNRTTLSVIAYRAEDYPRLLAELTPERVRLQFHGWCWAQSCVTNCRTCGR